MSYQETHEDIRRNSPWRPVSEIPPVNPEDDEISVQVLYCNNQTKQIAIGGYMFKDFGEEVNAHAPNETLGYVLSDTSTVDEDGSNNKISVIAEPTHWMLIPELPEV